MVFESLVVDLMNKYLGAYIENLDASQLSIGIWGGNVVLESLHVKGDALKDLNLPVSIKSGFIGKLTLKIPWKNLYKDAVEATLDGLYLLAVPNVSMEYDPKKEAERAQNDKQAQLQAIEDQLQKKLEEKGTKPKEDGFVEKLATQIIKNIQIHVKNIHVRYEDDVTVPGQPFALGVTLDSLDLQTTDEKWVPKLLDESAKIIYKMVSMKSLSVYWNCTPKILLSKENREVQLREFRATIASGDSIPDHFDYIIKPITMDAKLRLNPHPENELSVPKIIFSVVLQELGLHLLGTQYHNVMELVESMDRMSLNAPFAKFKPKGNVKGNSKIWWKYAYNSVLEAGVTRKMRLFSWKHIKEHRRKVKAYKKLYKEKLKQKKPPKDLVDSLIKMENELDVFNITLARQGAEAEMAKAGLAIKSKKSAHQIEEESSWFGGWFGGKKKKKEKEKEEAKEKPEKGSLEDVMDENEKKLLYEAIGYSEGEGPIDKNFAKEYVEVSVGVQLKKLAVDLHDDRNLDGVSLLSLVVDNIQASFKQRPTAKAIAVEVAMKSFIVDGLAKDGFPPHIVSSNLLSEENMPMSATGADLLSVMFETNPLDGKCDQRIHVNARPLQIIYDSATVNQLIEFFKPPPDVQLQQIRSAAYSAYEDIKDQTSTGLQHVMETRTINDINVKLMSSFVILPKDGKYSNGCEALVLDLGEVVLRSMNEGLVPGNKSSLVLSSDSETNLKNARDKAYDKFSIEVKKIQLLLAAKDEDWMLPRTLATSSLHVLEPINISLVLQKCVVENDVNLPKLKMTGEIPLLAIKMSDAKLKNLIDLATSIPLPPSEPDLDTLMIETDNWNYGENKIKRKEMKQINNVFDDQYGSNVSLSTNVTSSSEEFFTADSDLSDVDDITAEKIKMKKKKIKDAKGDIIQLTDFQASFTVTELRVGLSQSMEDGDNEILQLVVRNLGASATVRTWDTEVSVHLGGICMEYMNGKLPDGSNMYILDTPNSNKDALLLNVDLLIAKRFAPEFSTVYNNTEQSLVVNFSSLEVNANSKALLEIKEFVEKLIPPPAEVVQEPLIVPEDSKSTLTLGRVESGGNFTEVEPNLKQIKPAKKLSPKKRKSKTSEIINLKLVAILDSFSVHLSDEHRQIASVAIKGIETNITMLPSRICISAKLTNLLVKDPLKGSLYEYIVKAEGDDVLAADIVKYNDATSGDKYADMENVDTTVYVRLGSLRVVFVKRFIDTLVKFFSKFQVAEQVALEASAKAQEAATKSMVKLAERNPRIKLDILLSVPKIFIPRNSKSLEVVAADLGNIKVQNHFTIVGDRGKDNPAICDNMKIDVTDIKVALCKLTEDLSISSEYQILEPVSLTAELRRNMSASWFHGVPDIEIEGTMNTINVRLSGFDFKALMIAINENLTEMEENAVVVEEVKSVESTTEGSSPGKEFEQPQSGGIAQRSDTSITEVWDTLKLNFNISSVRLNLYKDEDRQHSLAVFNIQNLGLDLNMKSNSSMDLKAQLKDIILEDARLSHKDGITKFIERKMDAAQSPESSKNVIHACLIQKPDGSMDIQASIGSLRIILCLEFILKITNFFLNGLPKPEEPELKAVEKPTDDEKKAGSVESLVSETTIVSQTSAPKTEQKDEKSKAVHMEFKLYQPDIILVTDIKSSDSQALVLGMKLNVTIDVSKDGKEQKLDAGLTQLQCLSCPFATIQNITSEHKKVIAPCNITAKAKLSDTSQDLIVEASKIQITATPIVIQTLTDALNVLSPQSESEMALAAVTHVVKPDIWTKKKISNMKFWFIEKPEEELEKKSSVLKTVSALQVEEKSKSENLTLSVPDITIKLESGTGHHTVPLLIAEMKVNGEVKDWSGGKLYGKFELSLGVVYFNECLSVWEPLIEPVETNPGELDSTYELWSVQAEIKQSVAPKDDDVVDSAEEDLPPLISVNISSDKVLHTTISNAALKVINSLARAFADAAISKTEKRKKLGKHDSEGDLTKVSAEVKINNMLNMPLILTLGSNLVVVGMSGADKNMNNEYTLNYKDYLAIDFKKEEDLGIWALLAKQYKVQDPALTQIHVYVPENSEPATFDVSKTGTSLSTLTYKEKAIQVVCYVDSVGGIRTVTLRSSLMIVNHLTVGLEVVGSDDKVIEKVKPEGSFPLLTKHMEGEKLFVRPVGDVINVEKKEIEWKKLTEGEGFQSETTIKCSPTSGDSAVNMNVEVISEQVFSSSIEDTCYEIHVRPVLQFKNCLPFPVVYSIGPTEQTSNDNSVGSGMGCQVFGAEMNKSHLNVKIPKYRDTSWVGSVALEARIPELSVWTFKDEKNPDNVMVMGKQVSYTEGFMRVTLYSPYWMVNQTGFPLDYKAGENNIVQHAQEKQDFILFSFTSNAFMSKNKLQLRICNSNFSDGFSIDAVGSHGTIICKTKAFNYMIGTKISLTSFGLTKIVTFSSYYSIVNKTKEDLEIVEADIENGSPITLLANSSSLFWPESKTDQIKISLKNDKNQVSANIRYSRLDSGVLVKVGELPLFVDVSVTESSVMVTIKNYYIGSSAVMLVNHTSNLHVSYSQVKSESKKTLEAGHLEHYLWPEPAGKREISWKIEEGGKETTHDVLHELAGEIKFKVDKKERIVYFAVFVDGLQRVLLITENKQCAIAVEQGLGAERANIEISVSLQGLSCSIMDMKARREVMYMAITSSGIIWEEKPKKRWTALALKYSSVLEEEYQKTNQTQKAVEVEKYEFDVAEMKVLKPYKGEIRRFFSPGIWLQYTISDHQQLIHAKLNRLQVDNQLPAAVFPVVLYPIPLPKTIAIDSSPKPFIEFSLMQRTSEHQTFTHIKYFKILVQEFSVKLDMGFISAIVPVFGADQIKTTPERDLKYFNYDIALATKGSRKDKSEEMKDDSGIAFYDMLHLSPIKVHVSFSMQNTCNDQGEQASNVVVLPFNALAAVLKSIGVTVSDIDDVIFKLGYFERQYQFFNSTQFQKSVTMHYAGQAIKQLYVLVFGLDVIGNPYGLVMGIAEGVTDLFYEPYQGMIQGPGEFVEGLALGAMSLLGHTVGGAAGAVSRVTGALGKGIASMTMDDEYKKKRQMQKNKPADLKEGLARGGKGLVMGVVGGLTGVVTKPMEGAKKEGAAGFFKGMGKGIIGIVARPASGVIDLASNTFEGIQKLADMSEDVKRMRPARWINSKTGILQPYKLKKAQGNALLQETEKGKFADVSKYVDHVPLDKAKKSFLMLTDKMILEVHSGDLFGQWNSAWKFDYIEIVEEPHMAKEGIKLVGAKTKKMFGSKSHTKVVTFFEDDHAQHILKQMKGDWAKAQKDKPATLGKESKHRHSFHFSRKSKH